MVSMSELSVQNVGLLRAIKPKTPTGKVIGILVAVVLFLAVYKFFAIYNAIQQSKKFAPPPASVTTLVSQETEWKRTVTAVGSVMATQGVVLSSEVAGKVAKVNFESGAKLEKGAVLVELDSSVEEANLRAAEAVLTQAQKALERARTLRSQNANSQADLDAAVANQRAAEATVDSLRAGISRMKIVAPFSGTSGIRAVNVGQYVSPGTPIVPLFSMNPVYLNFSLPQQAISQIRVGSPVRLTVDAFPSENFSGAVTTINPQVDPVTRNVDAQATIPNTDERLRPGMFSRAFVELAESERVVAVPASAVSYAPYGDSVYVVEHSTNEAGQQLTTVRQQIVKLGSRQGELVAVTGVKPGEEVVTSGVFKLRPGALIFINNEVQPGASAEPKPADT